MAVTGDVWISANLAQVVPEIDPNNPGSIASLVRDKVNEVEGRIQETLTAVNNTLAAASSLLSQANALASALKGAQDGINELAGNIGNTGVYFRLLGVCPNFPQSLLKSQSQFVAEVARVLTVPNNDTLEQQKTSLLSNKASLQDQLKKGRDPKSGVTFQSVEEEQSVISDLQNVDQALQENAKQLEERKATQDPCIPNFVGDTALMGGVIIIVGAPDPLALWEKLKVLAQIFPVLQAVIKDAEGKGRDFYKSLKDFSNQFSAAKLQAIADQFKTFQDDLKGLGLVNPSNVGKGNGCDDWFCARLKDLLPMFDPNIAGSPLNLATELTGGLTDSVAGALNKVGALQGTASSLMTGIADLQSDLDNFKSSVFDFAANLAATGVYLHPIGRDATVHNNNEFIAAVQSAMGDTNDPSRPNFRGGTAVMAGLMLVIGAPNPAGLKTQFEAIGAAINGVGGKIETVTVAAADVGKSLGNIKDAISTKDVDPAYRVANPTPADESTTHINFGVELPPVDQSKLVPAPELVSTGANAGSSTIDSATLVRTPSEDILITATKAPVKPYQEAPENGTVPRGVTPLYDEGEVTQKTGEIPRTKGLGDIIREAQRRNQLL